MAADIEPPTHDLHQDQHSGELLLDRLHLPGPGKWLWLGGGLLLAVLLATAGWLIARQRVACEAGQECAIVARADIPPLRTLPGTPTMDAAQLEAPAVTPTTARALNAAVPFTDQPVVAARPFRFRGSAEDRERAISCLAAAQLYEAGIDERGRRAVAQVILNRARHPAFPASICGVVFQGAERRTGCQFTFTCDGSLRRTLPEGWWARARATAAAMIDGDVFAPVGLATHYHTDWVYPYWSPSLVKLRAIDTHLFFRWPGFWGSQAAFRRAHAGVERLPAALGGPPDPALAEAALPGVAGDPAAMPGAVGDPAAQTATTAALEAGLIPAPARRADAPLPAGMTAAALRGSALRLVHPDGGAYVLRLDPSRRAEDYLGVALRLCRGEPFCHVMGWLDDSAVPGGFPVSPDARARMSFSYRRDAAGQSEEARFDCRRIPRPDPAQCL